MTTFAIPLTWVYITKITITPVLASDVYSMIVATNENIHCHSLRTVLSRWNVLPVELTNTVTNSIEQLIGMKHTSPTFMYNFYYHINVGHLFPKCHFTYLLFLFRSGAPPILLLTADALTALWNLSATASSVVTIDATPAGDGEP